MAGRGLPLLSNQHAVAASGWAGLGCAGLGCWLWLLSAWLVTVYSRNWFWGYCKEGTGDPRSL